MNSDKKGVDIQIEKLKAKSIQLTVAMVKNRLSDFLVDEIIEADQKFKEVKILFQDIESKEDLSALKGFFDSSKAKLSAGLLSYCLEELREITSDLKWSNSKKGKTVLQLEKWVISAREYFSNLNHFKTIFIGRDWNDPELLIISGIIESDLQQKELEAIIKQLKPPVAPKYILEKSPG